MKSFIFFKTNKCLKFNFINEIKNEAPKHNKKIIWDK